MAPQCGVNAVVLFSCQNCGDMGIYRGAGAFGGEFTSRLSPQGDFTWDWLGPKSKSPLFPGPGGAVFTIDWCIMIWCRIHTMLFESILGRDKNSTETNAAVDCGFEICTRDKFLI